MLESFIYLDKSFGRADRYTNGPADFEIIKAFLPQISDPFEFFQIVFDCFEANCRALRRL